MTTQAKIEANRRNGQLSTGPRTAVGKATVRTNATKHGIFSAVPVILGEDPEAWQLHRDGVVASLLPVGMLEVNLAERVSLLLWRLQRLARYEAEIVTAAMEASEVPPLPEPITQPIFPDPPQKTRDEQLGDLREELRKARQEFSELVSAREFFSNTDEADGTNVVPLATVESVLGIALSRAEVSENLRGDPPEFHTKAFLKKLGHLCTAPSSITWTAELVRRAISVYAKFAQEAEDSFLEGVRAEIEERSETSARTVQRLERECSAIVRLLSSSTARKQVAMLLPTEGRDERITKYERHLHSMLTSTLHELERFQTRREGEFVAPPAVADVNVAVQTE